MTADDLLARIDSTTEQWDTWDGRSADAARWSPIEPVDAADVPSYPVIPHDLEAFWRDVAEAFKAAIDAIRPTVESAADVMAEIEQAQQHRAKQQPPMWAVQPNRERRR